VAASIEKTLGALPVVADFCRRLDVAGIIDRACPVRSVAHLGHGQVIEALIANRLTSPAPLVRVSEWAEQWAVEEVFGIDSASLNDDRIGRALDAIAPELDSIVGSVGAQAISAFGLDVSQLRWDMTSISLYGAYEQTEDEFAAPKFGHLKDRRPDLQQIQAGLAVTADGGVPVFHRAYDGGAAEVSPVVGAMTAVQKLATPPGFLLVGDSTVLHQPRRDERGRGHLPRPGVEDLRAGHGPGHPRPRHRHRGRLRRRARHEHTTRQARPVAGARGHHDHDR
jgi:hypothetical protein